MEVELLTQTYNTSGLAVVCVPPGRPFCSARQSSALEEQFIRSSELFQSTSNHFGEKTDGLSRRQPSETTRSERCAG